MQGLNISIVGLLITFFALGLFILIMIALQRIFPPKPQEGEEENGPEAVIEIEPTQDSLHSDKEQAVVAVIAAAISYIQGKKQSALGTNLAAGHGRWWVPNQPSVTRTNQRRKIERGLP